MATGGIALGVASLILALAALSGFQDALRSEVLARTPEIEVELPRGAASEAAAAELRDLAGIASVERLIRGRGWLLSGGRVQAVSLVGYEGDLPAFFPREGQSESGLYLPDQLAASWLATPGDLFRIASPLPALTPFGRPVPRLRSLPLAGVFETGRTEEQPRVALPFEVARQLLGSSFVHLAVEAGGQEKALDLARRLSAHLPEGAVVKTFRDLNRPLFFALRLEKILMFVAVSLIVVVAGLALVADLALIIANKRPEIGMLEAMGATRGDLRWAFLLLGALLSGIGSLAGATIGLLASYLLDAFEVLQLPGDVYFLDHVPFRVLPGDLLAVMLLTFLLALGSSWWAARRAATLRPMEALAR